MDAIECVGSSVGVGVARSVSVYAGAALQLPELVRVIDSVGAAVASAFAVAFVFAVPALVGDGRCDTDDVSVETFDATAVSVTSAGVDDCVGELDLTTVADTDDDTD